MSMTILICDDEENAQHMYRSFLNKEGYDTITVGTLNEARDIVLSGSADIVLLDVQLPDGYGPRLLDETAHIPNRPPIIVITGHAEVPMAVGALKNGASDFLEKPIDLEVLKASVLEAADSVRMVRELNYYRREKFKDFSFVIGDNPIMQDIFDKAARAGETAISVLITGEPGTGKEVVAKAVHQLGSRKDKPYVDLNCAGLQPTMLESELFGHEKGAFTDATKTKEGLMEVADGGVLFLDEISAMHLSIQAKVLRALQERYFRRVGGNRNKTVDIQVVAASNRDLEKMIAQGEFRDDLYWRLKVLKLDIPPLRDRKDDIPEFVGFFVKKFNREKGWNISNVSKQAMQAMKNFDWPGNVRHLEHTLLLAMAFSNDGTIQFNDLPAEITSPSNG